MTETAFFRLLDVEIEIKGKALHLQIDALNDSSSSEVVDLQDAGERFTADPAGFSKIPKSPFAYWVSHSIRQLYADLPPLESGGRITRVGDHPGNQERYVRFWWEVSPVRRSDRRQWLPYQKGGTYSPYFGDIHLVVDWDLERQTYYDFYGRPGRSSEHPSNYELFFRPGLTWPRRTNDFGVRVLPTGCVFADKGPWVMTVNDNEAELMALLPVMNSTPFQALMRLQLARTELARSYNVGLIRRTPVPRLSSHAATLASLAREAYELQFNAYRGDEVTHVFGVPLIIRPYPTATLEQAVETLTARDRETNTCLVRTQLQIDEIVFDLYGMDADDRALVRGEMRDARQIEHQTEPSTHVENLLMWCAGVAFGRWDVRKALDPSRLPPLGDPFDPLPRCAPGALVGEDGLPLPRKDLPDDYPLPIAWDGILVDDPDHPSDIVGRVQGVLDLLWGDRAGAIEREICDIIGVDRLRDYFRDYRNGFFAFHAKRYSKSRRKAPIYWLLQSEERHYAVWLYYHRLDTSMLYAAGRGYGDAKVELEQGRLETLRQGADTLEGSARRRRYGEIERQQGVVKDVRAFRNKLDQIALLDLAFDLNDGVLLNIAPLHELVPWTYADRTWKRFQEGRHGWSSMAGQLREAGLIQSPSKD